MRGSYEDQNVLKQQKPLQSIRAIEQSLLVLKQKLSQMEKLQNENVKQIEKVYYKSIPNLKMKLSESIECQKIQQKKSMLLNQSILKQKKNLNRQRKMINQKEIQRNRELITIIKMNDHNQVRKMSKQNQAYIQKMKKYTLQQNKRKKQLIRSTLQNSRFKINDFRTTKLDQINKQKSQQNSILQKKYHKIDTNLAKITNKQNQILQKVYKSEQALTQLRSAVDKLHKMKSKDFLSLKKQVQSQTTNLNEQQLIQKMLLAIIDSSKSIHMTKASRTFYHSKRPVL